MSKRKRQSEKDQEKNVIDLAQSHGLTLMTDQTGVNVQDWLPTGIPNLDRNAPMPFGRIIEIYGKNSSGKSTHAVHLMKQAQMFGVFTVLIDVEGTTSKSNMEQLGVDPSKIFHIKPEEDKNGVTETMTVEFVTEEMRKVVETFQGLDTPVLVIWDSLAQTPAEVEIQEGYNPNRPGTKSKSITHMLNVITQPIAHTNIMFIIVNQARDSMDNPMFPTIESPGGHALKHSTTLRLEVSKMGANQVQGEVYDPLSATYEKKSVGHIYKVKTEKSKLTPPGSITRTYLIAEPFKGLDFYENLYRSSLDQYKLVKKSGGWRKYQPEEGEEISLYDKDWVPFLESEEGRLIALELFIKQMERNFPEDFAPLHNDNIDITVNSFYAELKQFYEDGIYPTVRHAEKSKKEEKKDAKKEKAGETKDE